MEITDSNRLQQLLNIGKKVLAEPDIDHVLESSMDHLIEISGAERGIILLFNNHGDRHFQTARNLDKEDIENPKFEISNTIIDNVKLTGEQIFLENALREKYLDKSKSVLRLKILSVICIPLMHQEKVFGIIYLDNRTIQGRFSSEINQIISSFADFISLAAYHTMERNNWKKKQNALEEELRLHYNFDAIIGRSPQMIKVMEMISQVADTDATVLIEGESGTGKELTLKAIHFNSSRKDNPLLSVNCAAFPENLLESEFFGHEKGSFTGAYKNQKGKFELANKGTLFLDEIDEMSPALQSKLLRVIQFGEYSPLGSETIRTCDVRIVAASKTDLKKLVEMGKFREDLYYRINLFRINIPPLRKRLEDILPLAEYFLIDAAKRLNKESLKFNPDTIKLLQYYDYPGNVRELENIIHRAVILCSGKLIKPEHLPDEINTKPHSYLKFNSNFSISFKEAKDKVVSDFEQTYLRQVLADCNGNISKAAERIGMHKKNLHEKLNKYGISPK